MRLVIRGRELPGLNCGEHHNVHVGLQLRREPTGLVPADVASAEWATEISTDTGDFRGPAVQGRKGERFVYLTWGTVEAGNFSMFRRAKLMLDLLPADAEQVTVELALTDEHGMPRCARLPLSTLTIS
jgi:hypothetical protein